MCISTEWIGNMIWNSLAECAIINLSWYRNACVDKICFVESISLLFSSSPRLYYFGFSATFYGHNFWLLLLSSSNIIMLCIIIYLKRICDSVSGSQNSMNDEWRNMRPVLLSSTLSLFLLLLPLLSFSLSSYIHR